MDILVIALAAVALWGVSFSLRGHEDYLSRESTGSVKGIFAVIILYSHMRGYVTISPHRKLYIFIPARVSRTADGGDVSAVFRIWCDGRSEKRPGPVRGQFPYAPAP